MIDGLETINLVDVVERAGVEGRSIGGGRWKGKCPFHADQDPSFVVYPDGRWWCFSENEGGDAVDFVQKHYNVDFKDALKLLGLESGPMSPERQAQVNRLQRKRELVKSFRDWERRACDEVASLCRGTRKVLAKIQNEADLYKYGGLYHSLETYQYHLEILTGGDDHAKFEMWRAGYYAQ